MIKENFDINELQYLIDYEEMRISIYRYRSEIEHWYCFMEVSMDYLRMEPSFIIRLYGPHSSTKYHTFYAQTTVEVDIEVIYETKEKNSLSKEVMELLESWILMRQMT